MQPLAAAAARRGVDPDRGDPARAVPGGDGRDERALLGADPEWIGGILDVDALELPAVVGSRDRPHEVVRVRRVRPGGTASALVTSSSHQSKTWKTTSETIAPSMPP